MTYLAKHIRTGGTILLSLIALSGCQMRSASEPINAAGTQANDSGLPGSAINGASDLPAVRQSSKIDAILSTMKGLNAQHLSTLWGKPDQTATTEAGLKLTYKLELKRMIPSVAMTAGSHGASGMYGMGQTAYSQGVEQLIQRCEVSFLISQDRVQTTQAKGEGCTRQILPRNVVNYRPPRP